MEVLEEDAEEVYEAFKTFFALCIIKTESIILESHFTV